MSRLCDKFLREALKTLEVLYYKIIANAAGWARIQFMDEADRVIVV